MRRSRTAWVAGSAGVLALLVGSTRYVLVADPFTPPNSWDAGPSALLVGVRRDTQWADVTLLERLLQRVDCVVPPPE